MGGIESPSNGTVMQGPAYTPVMDRAWKKRETLKEVKNSVTWVIVNIGMALLVFMDMSFSMLESILEAKYPLIWYIDLTLLVVFVLNLVTHMARYLSGYIFGGPVEVTERQKQLLGVKDSEPGFRLSPMKASTQSTDGSLIFSSTPSAGSPYSPSASPWSSLGGHLTPTNLGSFSGSYSYVSPSGSYTSPGNQSGHVSFDRNASLSGHNVSYSPHLTLSQSLPYSPGASISSLDISGIRSRLSSSYRAPSPGDNITDIYSLSKYLKEEEEKEYKATLSSPDLTFTNQSFWSYGRPSLDYSHLRKNQYQLACRSPTSARSKSAGSRSEDTDNMGEEVWGPLGVTDDDLYTWIERLRKWIGQTVMVKLAKEIDNINAGLRKIGSEDSEVGAIGVYTLKQLAMTKGPYVPTLDIIIPYLDCSDNQEYLVKRLKDLGSDGCMSEFSWSSGGHYGKQWGEHLPTDAGLVMHMLCCYLDSRLPPEIRYPDGKTFTNLYFLKTPEAPTQYTLDKKANILIYQSCINPPHFQVVIRNTVYNLPKGRNNMFHAILFFLYHVKKEENGMLGRVNLGLSGVNILCVLDEN